jgi:predicted transcriptional regulator
VPAFGELEAAIMQQAWASDQPLRVRDLLDLLNVEQGRELAYTTVQTVAEILHRKGWLERTKDGRAFRYAPTASREEYTARLMDEALGSAADRTAALVHFAGRLDPGEAEQLQAALAEARRRQAES